MNAPTPDALARYIDLLEPVSAEDPCGPDLEYDPAFVMLQAAVAPRADAQYGDFVDAPQQANWAEAERDCRALLLRTKDLRLITILIRCRIRQSGAEGLRDGVALLLQMLVRYGEALHPTPMLDGERDPIVYSNAIAALADADAALADARDIRLPKTAGLQLQLRDIEKAFAVPRAKDALAPESASRLLSELWNRRDAAIVALADAQRAVAEIVALTRDTLQADAPDLDGVVKLLQPFAQTALDAGRAPAATGPSDAPAEPTSASDATASPPTEATPREADAPAPSARAPRPMDRWSALAAIQETRVWFEQNEPSSPVIVLLRQSERMVGKRFSELANVIPAELLAQWDAIDV
ncbi:type VI secretion system ImpA family N-terminal domain-containing protein [Burkholderia ambifaria]|uniref:type VI secretion system protein TssA n=1 Tax=Burkholderia ambifaria TaxID=152480 RepID=UPI001E59D2C2|nr:type VI secretion system ImpA family N-terminal domain-containing protein [Burkholderia ambifaria]UEP48111.1 type VI secretion system ImpA family N-terminal domain-containing protein [Burkholderia ambifaria]